MINPRVRLFCDWDNDSFSLLERLKPVTDGLSDSFTYKNIQFVWDDSYDTAIVFNFPTHELKVPPNRAIAFLVEPPEIIDLLYPHTKGKQFPQVSKIYSFTDDPNLSLPPVYGIGVPTVPDLPYKEFADKPKKICMIASNKLMTPYHKRRLEIKDALLASDLPIDFYGRNMIGSDPRIKGEIPPMRKYEVLNEYQFCIDFENSPYGAITDKYFDPVLCNTVPLTNAEVLFEIAPANSYELILFDWTMDEILDKIRIVIEQKYISYYIKPLKMAKQSIRSGSMCLVEWIYQQVKELENN